MNDTILEVVYSHLTMIRLGMRSKPPCRMAKTPRTTPGILSPASHLPSWLMQPSRLNHRNTPLKRRHHNSPYNTLLSRQHHWTTLRNLRRRNIPLKRPATQYNQHTMRNKMQGWDSTRLLKALPPQTIHHKSLRPQCRSKAFLVKMSRGRPAYTKTVVGTGLGVGLLHPMDRTSHRNRTIRSEAVLCIMAITNDRTTQYEVRPCQITMSIVVRKTTASKLCTFVGLR